MAASGQVIPASGSFSWVFGVPPGFVVADGAEVEVPGCDVWAEDEDGEEVAPAVALGLADGEGDGEVRGLGLGLGDGLGDAGVPTPTGPAPVPWPDIPPSSAPLPTRAGGAAAAGQVFVLGSYVCFMQ